MLILTTLLTLNTGCELFRVPAELCFRVAVKPHVDEYIKNQKRGILGHKCYKNGTCEPGLVCAYDKCKREWVFFQGGGFVIGDPDDQRRTAVGPFGLMRTEVTVLQYHLCVADGSCSKPGTGGTCNYGKKGRRGHPVNCVSRKDASDYCAWKLGRLPGDAEWEFAARSGGEAIVHPWGSRSATCDTAVMNDPKNGGAGCGSGGTQPVCSKQSGHTAQGLCDMAGNVYEWVDDISISGRNLRGGSWNTGPSSMRVYHSAKDDPDGKYYNIGFRCACDFSEDKPPDGFESGLAQKPIIPPLPCPPETGPVGGYPPDAFEVYCAWRNAKGRLVKHGLYIGFYGNGQRASKGNYVDGSQNGKWTFWYENGRIRLEAEYRLGKKHGRWVFRDRKGSEVRAVEYACDKEVNKD